MESAVFAMKGGLELFTNLGFKAKEIRLIGGGAKSKLWRQIVADIMNLPVVLPLYDEAAALGGALQALYVLSKSESKNVSFADLCAEHVKLDNSSAAVPNPENHKVYEERYKNYQTMVNHLKDLYE